MAEATDTTATPCATPPRPMPRHLLLALSKMAYPTSSAPALCPRCGGSNHDD
jgi:hypothetical protein